MSRSHILLAGVFVPGLLHAAPAFASDDPGQPNAAAPDTPIAQLNAAPDLTLPEPKIGTDAPFGSATVVDEAKLADITGMADVKVQEQTANANNISTISGNIINGDPTTGTISFDGGAFGAFNGLALINTNTGNNVSINSAMNVNVAIQ
ncbi:hypothetical protein EDF56_108106 [Novosphingobium sp. PhB165]|uniref:hypothetical protein n=1 Tax=Novosphingobium sp. PhB165 TaxID=2485105 RepID=UPI00104DB3CB|nr:hypothetical protein [Novosphingobium sp. PhB165]TCM16118.1 hypothetical protein EDF56_108106 [Novosphingobium sp. PhB165]